VVAVTRNGKKPKWLAQKTQSCMEQGREKSEAAVENFSVVRGLGTWHCLPAGQPGHSGVPPHHFLQERVYECAVER
jgi:hypothetical protein